MNEVEMTPVGLSIKYLALDLHREQMVMSVEDHAAHDDDAHLDRSDISHAD